MESGIPYIHCILQKCQEVCEGNLRDSHETLKKCNRKDTDSDLEHENYCMEDVDLDLEDVNASETVALSGLCRPPQKCQKINHLTPVTIVLIKTWLRKSRFKKIRILLDSRRTRSIIQENLFVNYECKITPPPAGL